MGECLNNLTSKSWSATGEVDAQNWWTW